MAVVEVIVGSILVLGAFSLLSILLVQTGQLRLPQNVAVTFATKADVKDIKKSLAKQPYDYAIYNTKDKKLLASRYNASDKKSFEVVQKDKHDLSTGDAVFRYFAHKEQSLIIRQNTLPEFADPRLRKLAYNHLSYLLVMLGIFLVLTVVIIRLVKEISKDFRYVEEIALALGQVGASRTKKHVKIIEFEQVLQNLYKKSDELARLIENERSEKKDLSFQIAALSHDVKTPLTVVKGNVELLELTNLTTQQAEYLASISKSLAVFERYFNSMIDYARLLNDERQTKINVASFISDLLAEFSELAKTYKVALETHVTVESQVFMGNSPALERALVNIFVNACRYANAEAKQVTVTIKEVDAQLIFEIWNNGVPFSENVKKNAEKLFFTENGSRNCNKKHYGLGLAFAKTVSFKHKGTLLLLNPPSGGAKVIFKIKLIKL